MVEKLPGVGPDAIPMIDPTPKTAERRPWTDSIPPRKTRVRKKNSTRTADAN